MSPSEKKSLKNHNQDALIELMTPWPESWAGTSDDLPVGKALVTVMKPFIRCLFSQNLVHSTVRRHLDNCWVIGGEIIREINCYPEMAKTEASKLLVDAIAYGGPFGTKCD